MTVAVIDAFAVLFDLAVFIITFVHAWQIYRLQKGLIPNDQSLVSLMLKHGTIRFGIITILNIQNIVTSKTLRPTMGNVDALVQNSIAIILVCRFHLDLIERHGKVEQSSPLQLNETPSLLSNFRAAVNHIGKTLDDDFGDHDALHKASQSTNSEQTSHPLSKDGVSVEVISLEEVPRVIGRAHVEDGTG